MAATLEFVLWRQMHKDKFRKLLVCCLGGVQDTISNFHLSPNFPIKILILLEWTYKNRIWPWKPYIRLLDLQIYVLTLKCPLIIKKVPQVDSSVKNTSNRGITLAAICIS